MSEEGCVGGGGGYTSRDSHLILGDGDRSRQQLGGWLSPSLSQRARPLSLPVCCRLADSFRFMRGLNRE
jgi:hypothetical protein